VTDHFLKTPVGNICIRIIDSNICEVIFTDTSGNSQKLDSDIEEQINAYFCDPKHRFTLPTEAKGTAFQKRVWQALCDIPAGTTLTYGELAKKLKSSPRAVGQACRRNPTPIIVPCHRVTGANGIGGYAGDSSGKLFKIKLWLLQHEGYKPYPSSQHELANQ
jgi:methylated-DNA-[protein]-cysteine S-methyltransferase